MTQESQAITKPKTSWLSLAALVGTVGVTIGVFGTSRIRTCACGGPAAQGKNFVSVFNRAQQAYWLEHQQFAERLDDLGTGIPPKTQYYRYSLELVDSNQAIAYGVPLAPGYAPITEVYAFGLFSREVPGEALHAYVGAAFDNETGIPTAILCQANEAGGKRPAPPQLDDGQLVCAPGTNPL